MIMGGLYCPAPPSDVCTALSSPGCMAAVIGHTNKAAVDKTLYRMKLAVLSA
jgi:hypothetical protein